VRFSQKKSDINFEIRETLADDDKLRIIKVLSDSLHKKSDKSSLDNLFGAWKDDMSAEEIIESIHANRVLGTHHRIL
jgi:hypothetical protein